VTNWRWLSLFVTLALLGGAIAIGGGTPLSPATIARRAETAAENSRIAERNTETAARDTRALAKIARDVGSQLESSRRMLHIQLEIERSSRSTAERSSRLRNAIGAIERTLSTLETPLRKLAEIAERGMGAARTNAAVADRLREQMSTLIARYRVVTRESRELNRKARGYEKLREDP
jgi:hypothetical protein